MGAGPARKLSDLRFVATQTALIDGSCVAVLLSGVVIIHLACMNICLVSGVVVATAKGGELGARCRSIGGAPESEPT